MRAYSVIVQFKIGGACVQTVYLSQEDYPYGTVSSYAANSALAFKTSRTDVAEFWRGSFLHFTSGTLIDQVRKIEHSDVTGLITLVSSQPFSGAPAAGDTFVILTR
jgi:hypothetical protein